MEAVFSIVGFIFLVLWVWSMWSMEFEKTNYRIFKTSREVRMRKLGKNPDGRKK